MEEGEEEGRGGRPPSLAAHSLPPSLQTPLATAAPGPGRQLPGGACASGGRGRPAGPGEGRKGGQQRERAPGRREGAPPWPRREFSSTPPSPAAVPPPARGQR